MVQYEDRAASMIDSVPFLVCSVVMGKMTNVVRQGSSWNMMYANEIVMHEHDKTKSS